MKNLPGKSPSKSASPDAGESANRRRVGRVVHDERGSASVEWQDAPANEPRTVLEIEDTARAQRRLKNASVNPLTKAPREESFNPYQRMPGTERAVGGPRRDLRKLSKWIKMMREVEESKALDNTTAKPSSEE